jgi:diacylglycerol kinase (ATP)
LPSHRAFVRSFGHAGAGLRHLFRSQRNARIHLILTLVAVGLALWLGFSAAEWALLALTIGFVLASEALNTAVEAALDRISADHHPLAKVAKDTAAGAVLIAALTALAVAAFLLLPRLLSRLGS